LGTRRQWNRAQTLDTPSALHDNAA
jgi:hypothetical protein